MTQFISPCEAARERLRRSTQLLGEAACERFSCAHLLVAGLGAVGSYTTEALARSGIGRLTLVDFDVVQRTNINRQLYALESTLGQPKARLAAERVRDINPDCEVTIRHQFIDQDTVKELLSLKPDLVLDAIDGLNPKVALLAASRRNGVPVISCMGAALRRAPTGIRLARLNQVRDCRLAARVRKRLRQMQAPLDFYCLYSPEETSGLPDCAIAPPEVDEETVLERGRQRLTLGSLPTVTGIFGLWLAQAALAWLLDELPGPMSGTAGSHQRKTDSKSQPV